jgi:hypothetical protein
MGHIATTWVGKLVGFAAHRGALQLELSFPLLFDQMGGLMFLHFGQDSGPLDRVMMQRRRRWHRELQRRLYSR